MSLYFMESIFISVEYMKGIGLGDGVGVECTGVMGVVQRVKERWRKVQSIQGGMRLECRGEMGVVLSVQG